MDDQNYWKAKHNKEKIDQFKLKASYIMERNRLNFLKPSVPKEIDQQISLAIVAPKCPLRRIRSSRISLAQQLKELTS